MKAIFGPAGNSLSFKQEKNLSLLEYLESFNLKAYEYQCGMGVRITKEKAKIFGESLKGISISIHAPYYISLSSVEEEKRKKSVLYILKTAEIAKEMGAKRIVVHSGSCKNIERKKALALAEETLKEAVLELKKEGFEDVLICPETMGKINQLGDLDEVISLCRISENFIPCIDFGHLNARSFGGIKTKEDYLDILNKVENELGFERLKIFHSHFSKIEYKEPGGERKHLTFEDKIYGPEYEPLLELVVEKNLEPVFICESAGAQAEDAMKMLKTYEEFLHNKII